MTLSLIFVFTDLPRWRIIWCRFLDTYSRDKEKKDMLLKIESKIFSVIKKDVEAETGTWEGTRRQNRLADMKIAACVYNSFKSYSRGMKYWGEFFNFKRF